MNLLTRLFWVCAAGCVLLVCTAFWLLISPLESPFKIAERINGRSSNEIVRHVMTRMEGHNKFEAMFLGPLKYVQSQYERQVPVLSWTNLGKGQQTQSLETVRYDPIGRPIEITSPIHNNKSDTGPKNLVRVKNFEDFFLAFNAATAGQIIELEPGIYKINRRMTTRSSGTKELPIVVRSSQPMQAFIEFTATEGFNVSNPFWVFENLNIKGVCHWDFECEHAFHVVGKANNTVIRNNFIKDFDATVKVNGENGNWPDSGLIQFNTIFNTNPRKTNNPVTLIDIVGANNWKIADNIIGNFIKDGGNYISYGVFMKGAGRGGRMERNLIICSMKNISQKGARIGLSFGGGGTGKEFCRDKLCTNEYTEGVAANNIIAHCNDSGLDANNSSDILFAHNTLVNTAGISLRQKSMSVKVYGNLIDGNIYTRDGSTATLDMNSTEKNSNYLLHPDSLDFRWRFKPDNIPSIASVPRDFCNTFRSDGTPPGAIEEFSTCKTNP